MAELRNKISQAELKASLEASDEPRTTLSFYQYHPFPDPKGLRDELYTHFQRLGVLGRIYLAHEGINAQLSVPSANYDAFVSYLYSIDGLDGIRINIALEDDGKSFWVLSVKVRPKIVADGIDDPGFSMARRGQYLKAAEFNQIAAADDTVIVDMRNYYEYEVGHFQDAIEVPSDTFREQLPMAVALLEPQREKNIVLYCTGGIRCEKASAYFLHHGFPHVYHVEGGIIEYVRQAREQGLENRFKGRNFVFDNRLGEAVTADILSRCHQCEAPSARHHNCANDACHLLFIQCENCAEKFEGCCSAACLDFKRAPEGRETATDVKSAALPCFNNSQAGRRTRFFDVRGPQPMPSRTPQTGVSKVE